ncbi:MAG: signal peptidase I [Halodesulfurarchaeum sp.]
MSLKRIATVAFEAVVVLFVISLVAGQVLGQPILLGYVETGSMAPTLEAGDGFVAVPVAISGDVETGDVVVFRAEQLHGGGLVTHRIVGKTDRGYITKGDANPFTDQDGEEPPVKRAQIVAEALQVGESVVVIPNLGTAVTAIQGGLAGVQRWLAITLGTRSLLGPQGIAYILLALSGLAYVADLLFGTEASKRRDRTRDRETGYSTHVLLLGLAALLVTSATAAMVVPAGTQQYGVVSAEFTSERPTVIRAGTADTLQYTVPNAGLVPVHVYLEPASQGVSVSPHYLYVGSRGESTAALTLHAPEKTGYYRRFLSEHRYLAILPKGLVDALYGIHHWLPILVIDLVLGGGLYLIGWLVVGRGRLRLRKRQRDRKRSVRARARRLVFGMK